jgi:hypothetical protein
MLKALFLYSKLPNYTDTSIKLPRSTHMSCPINTNNFINFPGYDTTSGYLSFAADCIAVARDATLDYVNKNFHESTNSALSTVSDAVNAFYCTGPAFMGTVLCGVAGGYLFSGKNLISLRNAGAATAVVAGILLTSNKAELAHLAVTTVATAGLHFVAKQIAAQVGGANQPPIAKHGKKL